MLTESKQVRRRVLCLSNTFFSDEGFAFDLVVNDLCVTQANKTTSRRLKPCIYLDLLFNTCDSCSVADVLWRMAGSGVALRLHEFKETQDNKSHLPKHTYVWLNVHLRAHFHQIMCGIYIWSMCCFYVRQELGVWVETYKDCIQVSSQEFTPSALRCTGERTKETHIHKLR